MNWASNLQSQSQDATAATLFANWGTYYKYELSSPDSTSSVNSSMLTADFYTAVSARCPPNSIACKSLRTVQQL